MGGFPPQGAGGSGTGPIEVDVIDRANRLLGIIYGSQGQQVLQRAATFELLVQLRNAGIDIDPRQIRFLDFATDSVDVSGSTINIVTAPTSPILDFDSAQNVDRMESNTHTYTATGNFKLSSVEVSASGSVKIEIQAGDVDSETTRMVAFTSPSKPIAHLDFDEELQLTAGQRILVIRTNRENLPMDIYSTILGFNA